MNYKELIKDLKQGKNAAIYLFTGTEKYLAELAEKKLIQTFISPGMESLNLTLYSEKNFDLSELIANCETLPFMSDKRIIIVGAAAEFAKASGKKEEKRLLDYLEKPSNTTVLIIYWEKPDKRKKVYKAIEKNGLIVEFDKLNEKEFFSWINEQLKQKDKVAEKKVIQLLVERSMYLQNENKSLEMVDHAIEQLADYAGDRKELVWDDVLEVMPESIEEGIFKLIDYAMAGNKGKALLMLSQFYLEGESPFGVFNLLLRQIRQLIEVKIHGRKLRQANLIAKQMKLPVFVINRILSNAKKYSMDHLLELLSLAADLDMQMKTGEIDQNMGLELFILKM